MRDFTNQQHELLVFYCAKCKSRDECFTHEAFYFPIYHGHLCKKCQEELMRDAK